MPGTPSPVGVGPNGLPPFWNAVLAAIQQEQQATNGLQAGSYQTNLVDANGNTQVVIGQLNQTVTIGAAFQQPGVQVGTALPVAGQPNVGIAWQQGLITTTITLTKGSASATVGTNSVGNGMVIGAATVADPTTGVQTPAITPGTIVQSGGGTTSITLSQVAAESGSGLYCAACFWRSLPSLGWQTPTFSGAWSGTAQYLKDPLGVVHLRGQANNGTSATTAFTLAAGFRPGITDYYPCLQQAGAAGSYVLISTAGVVTPTYSSGTGVYLNGISFLAEN